MGFLLHVVFHGSIVIIIMDLIDSFVVELKEKIVRDTFLDILIVEFVTSVIIMSPVLDLKLVDYRWKNIYVMCVIHKYHLNW